MKLVGYLFSIVLSVVLPGAAFQPPFEVTPAFGGEPRWQQSVHYIINCELIPKEARLKGQETLLYTNNSPDTLPVVFFHLYLNAFRPGSYMDLRQREFGNFEIRDLPEKEWGEQKIDSLAIEDSVWTKYEQDNTILKVELPKPLLPGEKIRFFFAFTDRIPRHGARMGKQGNHYDIGQWYPKICVYDHKGWHTDQYMPNGEFYGDYGTFEVTVTLPKRYLLGHTGELLNEVALFPDGLPRARGDTVLVDILKSYHEKDKQRVKPTPDTLAAVSDTARVSGINPDTILSDRDTTTWTWRLYAENVHDFAFTADPDFIWDRAQFNGITVNTLYLKDKKEFWQKQVAIYTREILKFLSQTFGEWPYQQFTAAEAGVGGGMEYPQLVFITRHSGARHSHSLFGILAHEIAHNWFYGLIGNNETRQAFLDEGFTTFATTLAYESYFGRYNNNYTWTKWYQKILYPNSDDRTDNFRSYLSFAKQGREDPIDTHSDKFRGWGAYGNAVYAKTASVLFMLQYLLGDSLFARAMRDYFDRWHFRHPYKEDFIAAIEKSTSRKLDWFFDQWLDKTFTCDYAIERIANRPNRPGATFPYLAEVKVRRHGRAIMPLDLHLGLKSGDTLSQRIPVELWQNSETERTFTYELRAPVKKAVLNPDLRVQDINRLNNFYPRHPVQFQYKPPEFLFPGFDNRSPLAAYQLLYQPRLWYNDQDKIRVGVALDGSYLSMDHILSGQIWVGLHQGQTDFALRYSSPLYEISPQIRWNAFAYHREGRQGASIGITLNYGSALFSSAARRIGFSWSQSRLVERDYLSVSQPWSAGRIDVWSVVWSGSLRAWKANNSLSVNLATSTFRSQRHFRSGNLEVESGWDIWKKVPLNSRIYIGYSEGDVPLQSLFYLASANPSEQYHNRWYSSRGTLPELWKKRGNLFLPGGGNLRGYLDRNAGYKRIAAFNLTSGIANPLNLFLSFLNLPNYPVIRDLQAVRTILFFDLGQGWDSGNIPGLQDFFSDFGIALDYRFPYQSLRRLLGDESIRAYFPIWISNPLAGERAWKFRWLLAYSTKF